MRIHIKAVLREPLIHFLVIGSLLFVAYAAFGDESEDDRGSIVVSRGRIEVYSREAISMGLDRDDTVIRRRLRQKFEFLLDDATAVEPTEAELEAFRQSNASRFRTEPRMTFDQIYLDSRARGKVLDAEIGALRARLKRGGANDALGDATLLPRSLASATRREIEQQFGPQFARSLDELPVSDWQGPVPSAYGVHLVRVTRRVEGELPPLATVRDAVQREWMNEQRKAARDAHYRQLLSGYSVSIERLDDDASPPVPNGDAR
jgi:hypothetical protein